MAAKKKSGEAFTPIGKVLATIIDDCRKQSRGGIQHLIHAWDQALGPPISQNARPFAIKGSLLLVHVSSSAWMHQLRFLKHDLLEALNRVLGDDRISDIKFKIGPL